MHFEGRRKKVRQSGGINIVLALLILLYFFGVIRDIIPALIFAFIIISVYRTSKTVKLMKEAGEQQVSTSRDYTKADEVGPQEYIIVDGKKRPVKKTNR